MADPRHLRNAPITEMLFDLRLASPTELTDEHFGAIRTATADRYPKHNLKQKVEGTIKFGGGKFATDMRPLGPRGLFATSADDRTTCQFRSDGYTFNRLRPYTSWDELLPEALRLWNLYSGITGATTVGRVALRYINHLQVPLQTGEDFSLYLTMPPNLPEPLPQSVSAFSMRFTAHDVPSGIAANITQSLGAAPSPQIATLLLDVDVFKTPVPPVRDEAEIRAIFAELHEVKNRVFFNLVTERCLQLYQ